MTMTMICRFIIFVAIIIFIADTSLSLPYSMDANVPNDATGILQSALNSQKGDVVLPCGTWNVSGLAFSQSGARGLRGDSSGCSVLRITTDSTAISCRDISSQITISGLSIIGTSSSYGGYSTPNIADKGQNGIKIYNCPRVDVQSVSVSNVSGTAFVCENPGSEFASPSLIKVSDITVINSYRAIQMKSSCEYALLDQIIARNNVFGIVIAAGNVRVSNFQIVYNSVGIKIDGNVPNPCHGSFVNGASNHNIYNLDIANCPIGHEFVGVSFIGSQIGYLTDGGGVIRIANSRLISMIGGTIGSNVIVLSCDPVSSQCSSAGTNQISNNIVRDNIPGWSIPVSDYANGFIAKGNFDASGLVNWNN